jgi:type II secretory pathway predicted ATPase ExeA
MKQKIRSFYGLKWNPFTSDLPIEGIALPEKWKQIFWRIENLVMDGGFALVQGDSGLGKSIFMRALHERLSNVRDIQVQILNRPQSSGADFYRELGSLFGVPLVPSNRWAGFTKLREKWQEQIRASALRPVLLIDEAQEMNTAVMSELRLLTSRQFDSQILLTVVMAGDYRLSEKLKDPDLVPLGTRFRARLQLEPLSKEELINMLTETITKAGCPHLLTDEVKITLAEHALQNPRIMMGQAAELLNSAAEDNLKQIDVEQFFVLYPPPSRRKK